MRHNGYTMLFLETGEVERRSFTPEHFTEAGLPPMTAMPVLEAHELINKWNRAQQSTRRFVYWLD